ncbi:CU044_2847 family protein [Crossiella sp. NPDC003009]
MSELVRFELAGGGEVTVELEEQPGVVRAARPGQVLQKARAGFTDALSEVRTAAEAALRQFQELGPDEVELKFGVKLDAQAGAVIARTGVQGHFEVKLKWQRQPGPLEEVVEEQAPAKEA